MTRIDQLLKQKEYMSQVRRDSLQAILRLENKKNSSPEMKVRLRHTIESNKQRARYSSLVIKRINEKINQLHIDLHPSLEVANKAFYLAA